MRERKYKVWDKYEKKWWGGFFYISPYGIAGFVSRECIEWEPERFVLVDWTGAVDDNDVAIYEKDIIKYKYLNTYRIELVGEIETFGVCLCDERKTRLTHACNLGCEVIGNIYENPELLEVKT